METTQIYALVNSVYSQMAGVTPVTATDVTGLIAMGDSILSSGTNTEAFMNTLVQRIGRTIISYRKYTNKLSGLMLDDFEWGAIVQKIKVVMPTATDDKTYELTDGESVDMYIVSKPEVQQKLFVSRTPYSFFITIQKQTLKEAFMSETAMGSFVSAIFGEVQNKLEIVMEDLGRTCMCSFMGAINGETNRVVNLVSDYNALTGESLTADTALFSSPFLRYAMRILQTISKKMETMSELYNDGSVARHTPIALQRYCALVDFNEALATVVQWQAFNEKYVSKATTIEIPYWQGAQTPDKISITRDGVTTTIENVIAFIHDRDALGMYKREEDVLTTPFNASGRYSNTFWHEQELWFNDISENGVIFTLN